MTDGVLVKRQPARQFRSKSGASGSLDAEVWSYRDGVAKVNLNFRLLPALSPPLQESLKQLMASYARTGSPASLSTRFKGLLEFFRSIKAEDAPIAQISGEDFLNFRAAHSNVRTVTLLRATLRKWVDLGLTGAAGDLAEALERTRLPSPVKGLAVARMDPKMGPLTDTEFQAFQQGLNDAYEAGFVPPWAFVALWLFMATGARPAQLAAMKVKDVHCQQADTGTDFSIDVPRVKQGGDARAEFKNRPLVASIGRLVLRYAQQVEQRFVGRLDDPKDAPLFPKGTEDAEWSVGFEYHRHPELVSSALTWSLTRFQVISERTGQPLHVTPLRLRRTFGTRAAQEGHGVLIIAELLDHTDTQHAGVYVETRPDIASRLDKATALEMAPIAQAFSGKLITSEAEASCGSSPGNRIRDLRVSTQPLASCGSHSFCGLNAPLACYTCKSFEPWLDGPHEAVLDALLAKRERQLGSNDARIATVHDRTILAVAQVVQLCTQQRGSIT